MINEEPPELNINVPEYVGIQKVPPEMYIDVHEYVRIREVIKHVHMQYRYNTQNWIGN